MIDLIVSLSPEAHHKALQLAQGFAVEVEYWPTQDPTLTDGRSEQILDAYRVVRGGLFRRIKARFPLMGGSCPLLTDAVEKVDDMPPARNNRIMGADFLNRSCAFDARLESMLLGGPPRNPFSTASVKSRGPKHSPRPSAGSAA